MKLIDQAYTAHPFYGSRRMRAHLANLGYVINRKRAQRLMRMMGLEAIYPKPNLSARCHEHKIYPYLLRGYPIEQPNVVWSADITYYGEHLIVYIFHVTY
ncbi:MAG: IS3 family transposase [Chlamydiales bacterium]